jgi:hypothetical protein
LSFVLCSVPAPEEPVAATSLREAAAVDLFDVGESWVVGLVLDGETFMSMRANRAVTDAAPFASHPLRLAVRIPLNAPSEHGFPTNAEGAELQAIEDRLDASLGSPPQARLCASVTSTKGVSRSHVPHGHSGLDQALG